MLLHMYHLNPADRTSFKAALLLAFYGFLRCSEYTVNCNIKNNFLRRKDIRFEGRKKVNLLIKLRKTKTIQFSTSFVQVFENKAASCPVNAMRAYLQFFNHNRNDPLFWFQAQPLSSVKFNEVLRQVLSLSAFNPKVYSSHSLRSGAASAAADHGVPAWLIQKLGRWKSDCFKRYIPDPKEPKRKAQLSMSS